MCAQRTQYCMMSFTGENKNKETAPALLHSRQNRGLDPSHRDDGTVLEAAPQHLTMCLVPC